MGQKYLSIKNHEKYQHYKDRNPKWVKLYWDLLSDDKFVMLTMDERALYLHMILLASRHENIIPFDLNYIRLQLKLHSEPNLKPLINAGFLLASCKPGPSKALAKVSHDAIPLRSEIRDQRSEKELEREKEKKEGNAASLSPMARLEIFTITENLKTWADGEGIVNPELELDEFKDYWRSIGGKRPGGKVICDWDATFKNRLRDLKRKGQLKTADWREEFLREQA